MISTRRSRQKRTLGGEAPASVEAGSDPDGLVGWETVEVENDPTQFLGSAQHYKQGRPPYSAQLGEVLVRELGLDGTGRALDLGSGPGTVGVALAPHFERVWLLEPDADMLEEARAAARAQG